MLKSRHTICSLRVQTSTKSSSVQSYVLCVLPPEISCALRVPFTDSSGSITESEEGYAQCASLIWLQWIWVRVMSALVQAVCFSRLICCMCCTDYLFQCSASYGILQDQMGLLHVDSLCLCLYCGSLHYLLWGRAAPEFPVGCD